MDNHSTEEARKLRKKPILQAQQSTQTKKTGSLLDRVKISGLGVKVKLGEVQRSKKPPVRFQLKLGHQERHSDPGSTYGPKRKGGSRVGARFKVKF